MDHVFVMTRLFLAVVLTVAGSAKLADRAGTRRAFVDFGGPAPIASIAAWLLPVCEIAVALALLSGRFAMEGAVAALALFGLFSAVLGLTVARRGDVDCHCFGQLSTSPVSWRTLVRTCVLAAAAGSLVYAGRGGTSPGVATWLAALLGADLASSAALLAVVGAIAWIAARARESRRRENAVLERVEALERRLAASPSGIAAPAVAPEEGLPVGAPAPGLSAPVYRGRPVLILFVSSSCPPCKALLPEVASWRERLGGAAELVVVNRDDGEGKSLAEAFRARWTPAGVLVGGAGRVASPLRYGTEGVSDLFAALRDSIADGAVDERALHRRLGLRLGASSVVVGDPAPEFELVDAEGRRRGVERFAGEETLLLFWDPGCSYCQGMADELEAIEAAPPAGAPRVAFVVPRAADEASAAQAAFSSPSFFDPDSRVAPHFGARGTPSAVLLDRDGRVASTAVVGKDAILHLLAPVRRDVAQGA